jgi:hypothetical protein
VKTEQQPQPLKIVSLTAENVKRLSAVHITPDGSLVVIGGRNAQGKSSVLDAITYALGGKEEICAVPVRRGEKTARVVCNLGDLVITRTFTATGGGSLKVTGKDGASFPSPQAVLNKLVGSLSFDPLAFARLKPAEQAETLRVLVGLDFTKQEYERRKLYEERTIINRRAETLKANLETRPQHPDAPSEEVDAGKLTAELDRIAAVNRQHAAFRQGAEDARENAQESRTDIEGAKGRIAELRAALADEEASLARQQAELVNRETLVETLQERAAALVDEDAEPVKVQLRTATEVNRKVRDNAERRRAEKEMEEQQSQSRAKTTAIDAIDAAKTKAISEANFPTPGLGFAEDGTVTLNGLPFSQSSSAEQLRSSVAMGIALNPRLRVLLIRDGSLLDADSLAMIAAMATEANAQLWIERVGHGAECAVIIEDGCVEAAPSAEAAASA